jgi:hypothetical protein
VLRGGSECARRHRMDLDRSHDHIIVGKDGHASLKALKLI